MRAFLYILFSISSIVFGTQSSWGQNQINPVSETKQIYLDKATIIERRLGDIDLKWNWIVVTPSEDSIAKAQGWYLYMGEQRDLLKIDLVNAKIEQLKNYYQDIIDLFASQDEILKLKITEMEENRNQLAPNYPVVDSDIITTILNDEFITKWIVEQPQQYLDFTAYLEKLVLNNF